MMAPTQGKRTSPRAHSTPDRKRPSKSEGPRAGKKKQLAVLRPRKGRIEFPEAAGMTLKSLELWLEPHVGSVVLNFSDRTVLQLDLAAGFMVDADYSDWKTHNWRPIKRWRPLRSPSPWR
jgi:hypothetical protein